MQPLSKKKRAISWAILFVIFLILAPLILYRSFGYKIDELRGVIKTGGIYIHSDLSSSEIFVDGKYFKNNGVLLKNTLVQDLDPLTVHKIEMHKEGYHSWIKELSVAEGLVTEAVSMMLPIEMTKTEILPYIDSTGAGTTTAMVGGVKLVKNATFTEMQTLFDLVKATTTAKTVTKASTTVSTSTKEVVPKYFTELGIADPSLLKNLIVKGEEISWLDNGNVLINWIGKKDATPFYYCILSDCRKQISLDWKTEILRFDFMPNKNHILLVLNSEGLWAVEIDDRSDRNIQPIFVGNKLDFRINENNRIVILQNGSFFELRF